MFSNSENDFHWNHLIKIYNKLIKNH